MTVCVSVKVHDCLVFAADSASTLTGVGDDGRPIVLNVWPHANKVYNLYKQKPVAAMTCGLGQMGPASISNIAKDLRFELMHGPEPLDPSNYTIEQVADRALQFFEARYQAHHQSIPQPQQFEFWVGGYDAKGGNAKVYKIVLQDSGQFYCELVAGEAEDGHIAWAGQPKAIHRLLIGFDDTLPERLIQHGASVEVVGKLVATLQSELVTPLVHAAMPVQDAINLADFLVDITKKYFAFLPGADVVGGFTDIATITKHEGFKWVRRKHYYDPALNPRETDHV